MYHQGWGLGCCKENRQLLVPRIDSQGYSKRKSWTLLFQPRLYELSSLYFTTIHCFGCRTCVIGSQILHRHLSDKERRKNDVNFLKKWIFFLSFFIDFLKTTYLKKGRKKCRHVFLVKKSWCSSTHHVCIIQLYV